MEGDLLDASWIETRHLKIKKRPVDFASPVREVVERFALIVRGHPVDLDVQGEIPWLDVDPGRIDQVLGNLLTNAAKYAYPDTEIRVEVACIGGEVRASTSATS